MGIEKYRVHEVAKDFGLPTKAITEILTKYAETPKNHMQVLTDRELSVIFDYLTQNNQVSSIQVIYADAVKEQPKAAAPAQPKTENKPAPQQSAPKQNQQSGNRPQQNSKPNAPHQQKSAPQQQAQQPAAQQQPATRVPQKKIVDTRKGGDVNLDKYDERLEDLGGERGQRMQKQGGKEKFRNNNKNKGNMTFSNKRKQDEAEKMRKLQLEIAKKAPVKVQIPD